MPLGGWGGHALSKGLALIGLEADGRGLQHMSWRLSACPRLFPPRAVDLVPEVTLLHAQKKYRELGTFQPGNYHTVNSATSCSMLRPLNSV